MDRRGIRPYDSTLVALSVGHSKSLQLDLAEHFLGRISDIQPEYIHAFNALLSGCDIMVMYCLWKEIVCHVIFGSLPSVILISAWSFMLRVLYRLMYGLSIIFCLFLSQIVDALCHTNGNNFSFSCQFT